MGPPSPRQTFGAKGTTPPASLLPPPTFHSSRKDKFIWINSTHLRNGFAKWTMLSMPKGSGLGWNVSLPIFSLTLTYISVHKFWIYSKIQKNLKFANELYTNRSGCEKCSHYDVQIYFARDLFHNKNMALQITLGQNWKNDNGRWLTKKYSKAGNSIVLCPCFVFQFISKYTSIDHNSLATSGRWLEIPWMDIQPQGSTLLYN